MTQPFVALLAFAALPASAITQASWSRIYPPLSPPPRHSAVLACYEATGDVVLVGGQAQATLQDAWRLQGNTWTPMAGVLPPGRFDAGMVYDSWRQRLVLFGGLGAQGNHLQDTWEWNGAAWALRQPATSPSPRRLFAMAFDPLRGVTVLFGGFAWNGANVYHQDLWEWDGAVWQERQPAVQPPARTHGVMAFDPVGRGVLLHGGIPLVGGLLDDTWSWNGVVWQRHLPLLPPSARMGAAMVGDPHRQRVLLVGGRHGDQFAWEWDGQQWDLRMQAAPGLRTSPAVAYDGTRRRMVLFGGEVANVANDDTWIFQTPTPARVVPFGAGCAGSAGVPQLANVPYSLPWLGDTCTMRVGNLAVGSAGAVFATGFASTPPISLLQFGMPGCDQLVLPAVAEFRLAALGVAEWTLAVPNTTALANVHLFQQAFPLDAAANAAGLVASNGVELTTGIR